MALAELPRSLFMDTSRAMEATERYFLDNKGLLSEIASCLHDVNLKLVIASSTRERVVPMKCHLSRRL